MLKDRVFARERAIFTIYKRGKSIGRKEVRSTHRKNDQQANGILARAKKVETTIEGIEARGPRLSWDKGRNLTEAMILFLLLPNTIAIQKCADVKKNL